MLRCGRQLLGTICRTLCKKEAPPLRKTFLPALRRHFPPAPAFPQAYFSYDAHKSGGVTVSHLRFGPKPIRAPFLVDMAHYIGVHQEVYFSK